MRDSGRVIGGYRNLVAGLKPCNGSGFSRKTAELFVTEQDSPFSVNSAAGPSTIITGDARGAAEAAALEGGLG